MLKHLGVLCCLMLVPPCPTWAQYTEVPQSPQVVVGQRTLEAWVADTPFGSFLGVFERDTTDGKWYGLCTTTLVQDLAQSMATVGGPEKWVDAQLLTLNACLRSKFSTVVPTTPEGIVNGALANSFRFTTVGGVPALGRK